MERSAMEYAFCAIWARYQKSNQESVTLEQLKSWAIDKGLCVTGIERKEIGAFNKTDCIVLLYTSINLPNLGNGFIEQTYDHYYAKKDSMTTTTK